MCLGIPGKIVKITDPEKKLGLVDVCGVQRETNLACVVNDQVGLMDSIGKWVLVHVGFAMSVIDEVEAKKTLEILHSLGEAQEEIEKIRQSVKPN